MPIYEPPAAATLTGDILTIHRLLSNPTALARRLRTISEAQFIADQLFTTTVEASGGAVAYEVSESIFTDRVPEAVTPGAEYPRALAGISAASLATVTKWGQDVPITDEAIGRMRFPVLDRALIKVTNQMAQQVDTVCLAAAAAAITQTQAAAFAWNTATADPFLDLMLAQSIIEDLGQGYMADKVFVTKTLYARLVANQKVISGLARESTNVVTNSGDVKVIAGLELVSVPASRMPSGVTVMVIDTNQFGFLGYENVPSPEYAGDPASGIEVWSRRNPSANDSWLIRGRRPVVPAAQEPNSGVKVTGA
jgi:hypothetical protein